MRNPLSDKVVEMKPSGIRKFFDLVQEMPNAISLGVGEPDFDTPWHIRDEGIYSLENGRTFYTSNAGLKELKIEICNYLSETTTSRSPTRIGPPFKTLANTPSVGMMHFPTAWAMAQP